MTTAVTRPKALWRQRHGVWVLWVAPGPRYIEWRPKLQLFDVMQPDALRLGFRSVPQIVVRTNSLFEALTWVLRQDSPNPAMRRDIFAATETGRLR